MVVTLLAGLGGLGNLAGAVEHPISPAAIAAERTVLPLAGAVAVAPLATAGDSGEAAQRRSTRLPMAGALLLLGGLTGAALWLWRRSPSRPAPAAVDGASPPPAIAADPAAPPPVPKSPPAPPPLTTTRLSREAVVDSLVGDLAHTDGSVRRQAVWELGQRGNSDAIQPLINRLLEADSQEKSLILAALAEISSRSLKPMHRALALGLQDPSPEVRKNAIRDLSRVYDTVVQLSAMLAHAAQDPDPSVQETARWALGQLNRIPAAPYSPALPAEAAYDGDRLPPG